MEIPCLGIKFLEFLWERDDAVYQSHVNHKEEVLGSWKLGHLTLALSAFKDIWVVTRISGLAYHNQHSMIVDYYFMGQH